MLLYDCVFSKYGNTQTNIEIKACRVLSSTINGIESIIFYTNVVVAHLTVLSLNRLTSNIKASPAMSFNSVCSRYFTSALGKYIFEQS